jgi:uncharacterized protein DUF6496
VKLAQRVQLLGEDKDKPIMPEERTKRRAAKDKAEGKAASTQAGEFVREEIEHVREGKHGARSTKQAIAIGLSKARREGVALPPPKAGRSSKRTIQSAARDSAKGRSEPTRNPSPRRSRATRAALEREPRAAATPTALSRQAKASARSRGPRARKAAASKAARTRARRSSTAKS